MKLLIEINYNSQEESLVKIIEQLKKDCDAQIIDTQTKQCKRRYTSEYFKKSVFKHYNILPEMADSTTRKREIVLARQIAMTLSKENTEESLATIAKNIGDMDHATVLHAVKTIHNLCDTDRKFRAEYEFIEKKFVKK